MLYFQAPNKQSNQLLVMFSGLRVGSNPEISSGSHDLVMGILDLFRALQERFSALSYDNIILLRNLLMYLIIGYFGSLIC